MNQKAFISYAAADGELAESVCAQLEAAGIGCWIAPRDISPGRVYAEAIVDGIASTSALVLLLSAPANESAHVHREVELAVSQHHPVVPIRVVEVEPANALQYLVSSTQWLDVNGRDISEWIADVAGAITDQVGETHAAAKATLIPPRSRTLSGRDDYLSRVTAGIRRSRRVTLHGIAGVGKTALAIEIAHRAVEEFSQVLGTRTPRDGSIDSRSRPPRSRSLMGAPACSG